MVAPAEMFCAATTTLSSWCRRMVVPPMTWFISFSCRRPSRSLGAGGVDIDRVQRSGRRDKQAVAALTAEGDIGHELRHVDPAQMRSIRSIAFDAGMTAGPQVALHVDPEAIRNAGLDVAEHPAVGQL